MRCVKCGRSTRYRSVVSGRCPGCGQQFVFYRKLGDPITDPGFGRAVATVNGAMGVQWLPQARVHWLRAQMYYEVCRRIQRRRMMPRWRVPIDYPRFEALLGRWSRVHGWPEGEIKAGDLAEPELRDLASDAGDYSFSRIVVCDEHPIVDFLLANRFHLDNATPVFAFDGYPREVYGRLEEGLKRNPPRDVFVLHDAETTASSLPERIRDSKSWFSDTARVIDAGLRRRDARKLGPVALPSLGAAAVPRGWPRRDRRWYAKHRVELAAIRPAAMLSVLGAVVRGEREPEERSDGGDAGIWPYYYADGWGDGDDDSG